MSLVPYEPGDTYGRVFLVGLLNTLLVAGVGVVLATLVGFSSWGHAAFSKLGCFHSKYLRRNFSKYPVAASDSFWYTAVLKPLPGPRQVFERDTEIYFGISNRESQARICLT